MSVRDVLVAIFVALIITLVIQAVVLNIKIINLENQLEELMIQIEKE
jgi:hypothetical protein